MNIKRTIEDKLCFPFQAGSSGFLSLYVNPTDFIEDAKKKLQKMFNIDIQHHILSYNETMLNEGCTFQDYAIQDGSKISINLIHKGGGCPCKKPSPVLGFINQDNGKYYNRPLPSGKLTPRYIRNTNATFVYEQVGGTCYAYAACSAYINTIVRIFGAKPPSFQECYNIACYNGHRGGRPEKSIQLLEDHFRYGILYDITKELSIKDAITISPIVCFTTSEKGWYNVASGSLLKYPGGKPDGSHAVLIEGYDLQKDCFICKNSWGGNSAEPRFDFTQSAAHHYRFIRVYFTERSIRIHGARQFYPRMKKFVGNYKRNIIECAWMDRATAIYTSDYVCRYLYNAKGKYRYIGYEINSWIDLNIMSQNINRKNMNEYLKKKEEYDNFVNIFRMQPNKKLQNSPINVNTNKKIEKKEEPFLIELRFQLIVLSLVILFIFIFYILRILDVIQF